MEPAGATTAAVATSGATTPRFTTRAGAGVIVPPSPRDHSATRAMHASAAHPLCPLRQQQRPSRELGNGAFFFGHFIRGQ